MSFFIWETPQVTHKGTGEQTGVLGGTATLWTLLGLPVEIRAALGGTGQTPGLGQHCQVQLPWAKSPPGPPQPVPQQCSGNSEVAFCSFPCFIPNLEAVGRWQNVELGKKSIAQVPQGRQGEEGNPSRCLLQQLHFLHPAAPGEGL